ncbi:MAG: replication-associated recombination protein A [candidate division Zixibacteria bacterium]|nr:replication-associated recombination protein A [candidate division Zixibacteria bacterium]
MDIFDSGKTGEDQSERADIRPLADRMRPRTFDHFFGQEKIIGPGTPLRKAIEADRVSSLLLWGPPGTGKTTLARMIARQTEGQFLPFSAVTSSIKEVKAVISKAANYYKLSGRRTYVFIDEIHRFNKAQQDAFLPYVEKGDIILIGATTENPSFEVISALLSRMRVFVLGRLTIEDVGKIAQRALTDKEFGLGHLELKLDDGAADFIGAAADGDARRALTLIEETAAYVEGRKLITVEDLSSVHQRRMKMYDKDGEEHYNIISALHKAMRGGDPDASLYWLARMLEGGEDPLYVVRRVVRFASEDVGMADPFGLTLALNARDAYHFLGSPEGELAIAQAVVYLACAPKSNSVYSAFTKAMSDVREKGSLPVPLWIRNAPTRLMKNLGYGKGYKYAHEYDDAMTDQEYFPEEMTGTEYFQPTESGREGRIAEYLEKYRAYRKKIRERGDNRNE